ncbi:barstar family protein [Pseudoduganella lurida]|nr:barstar family protein [Pseudoduganella lurida]
MEMVWFGIRAQMPTAMEPEALTQRCRRSDPPAASAVDIEQDSARKQGDPRKPSRRGALHGTCSPNGAWIFGHPIGRFEGKMSLFLTVPPHLVQSIRAFRVAELQEEAGRLGQHFLYAHCNAGLTKQQVLGIIAESFRFPKPCGKNFDALRTTLTETLANAGEQPGFVIVLEQLPNTQKFDREARETLLDVFRDAADYWAEKKVPFRVFYSFE